MGRETGCGTGGLTCENIIGILINYQGVQNDFSAGGTVGRTPLVSGDIIQFLGGSNAAFTFGLTPFTLPTLDFSSSTTPAERFLFTATSGSFTTSISGIDSTVSIFIPGDVH